MHAKKPANYRPAAVKLGRLLAELRGDRTQGDVAAAVGVTKQAVQAWESGRNTPYLFDLARVARGYCVSPEKLLRRLLDNQ